MVQPNDGAGRETLSSEAASPALIGRADDTTAEEAAPPAALRNTARRERGAAAYAAALAWADLNPDALSFVESRAATEAAAEHPVSVRALLEDVRRKDFADREGRPTRVNNSISAALGRLLVERNPALGPWVAFRQSVVDEIGG
ncbi:MAG: hypothetical protein ACLSBA_10030 [Adlercreutzia equolifaciens]